MLTSYEVIYENGRLNWLETKPNEQQAQLATDLIENQCSIEIQHSSMKSPYAKSCGY